MNKDIICTTRTRTRTRTRDDDDDATRDQHNRFSTAPRGITVTVYLESSSPPPQNAYKIRRSSTAKPALKRTTRFYDRRAELLAYSQQLRASTSRDPIVNSAFRSKPRAKCKWYLPLRKLQNAFRRVLRKDGARRYERIETDGMGKRHRWCHPKSMTCSNKAKTRISQLFKKLWRGCSRWKCNKVKLQQ